MLAHLGQANDRKSFDSIGNVKKSDFMFHDYTEGNGPVIGVSINPNRITTYDKIWIFVSKMSASWMI